MKKIMFSERFGLEQSVLAGTKTMTRRIIPDIEIDWNRRGRVTLPVSGFEHGVLFMDVRSILHDAGICDYSAPAKYQPKYEVGEEVWIAQSYKGLGYKPNDWIENCEGGYQQAHEFAGYTNKMFVRSLYLEHRIRITNIKLERLQDITDEDCLKEGVEKWIDCYIVSGIMENHGKNNVCFDTPREAFAALIDRISGRGTWQRNPWVYAYTFELIK